ncbi:MAG: DUF4224 domain-containing protein [Fluviibacter sp.]
MNDIFLTAEELVALTGFRRSGAQKRALYMMGVDFLIRPDASLVVSRRHVEELLGARPEKAKTKPPTEPNWAAI